MRFSLQAYLLLFLHFTSNIFYLVTLRPTQISAMQSIASSPKYVTAVSHGRLRTSVDTDAKMSASVQTPLLLGSKGRKKKFLGVIWITKCLEIIWSNNAVRPHPSPEHSSSNGISKKFNRNKLDNTTAGPRQSRHEWIYDARVWWSPERISSIFSEGLYLVSAF